MSEHWKPHGGIATAGPVNVPWGVGSEGRVPGGRECGDTGLGVGAPPQWAAIHGEGWAARKVPGGLRGGQEIPRGACQHLELVNN